VGENAPVVREQAAGGLAFLGVVVDPHRNLDGDGDREIGAEPASVSVLVVAAREDLEIARGVRQVLSGTRGD
jgi:acetate kinase